MRVSLTIKKVSLSYKVDDRLVKMAIQLFFCNADIAASTWNRVFEDEVVL